MVKINKVYTKTGDQGTTSLVGGTRIQKSSLRVESYGEVDELSSALGIVRTMAIQKDKEIAAANPLASTIAQIQQSLFDMGAELACPAGAAIPEYMRLVSDEDIVQLEKLIDQETAKVPELRSFVLPGGTQLNAFLHLARAICRRAERSVWMLNTQEPVRQQVPQYLNRLSDLLFTLARSQAHAEGAPEFLWNPGR